MNNIAVCEDDENMLMHINKWIQVYFDNRREDVEISSFLDLNAFLDSYSTGKYFMIFLDIDMKPMNGLDAAKIIWESDKNAFIVFETGHSEYATTAYGVHPFDYIIKPYGQVQINKVFDDYFSIKNQRNSPVLFEYKGNTINMEVILYLEKKRTRNTVSFITEYGKHDIYISLEKALEKLDDRFIRCHKGYIVNIDKLSSFFWKECIMKNGASISVGDKYKVNFHKVCIQHSQQEKVYT